MEPTKYSIQEVFTLLGEDSLTGIYKAHSGGNPSIEVEGFKVYTRSLRYQTFFNKGTKCVCCGKEGTHFRLDCDRDTDPQATSRRHFNLYADDGTLMTKDHILPKKWGGRDDLANMQTMCKDCNEAKGSQYNGEIYGIIAVNVDNNDKVIHYIDEESAIYEIIQRKHLLEKKCKPGKLAQSVIHTTLELHHAIENELSYCGYIWKKGFFKVEGKAYSENE